MPLNDPPFMPPVGDRRLPCTDTEPHPAHGALRSDLPGVWCPGVPQADLPPGQVPERDQPHLPRSPADPVLDPDCRDGKHGSCVGGPCECTCHAPYPYTFFCQVHGHVRSQTYESCCRKGRIVTWPAGDERATEEYDMATAAEETRPRRKPVDHGEDDPPAGEVPAADTGFVDDGFGNRVDRCGPGCDLYVVRPGKFDCGGGFVRCPNQYRGEAPAAETVALPPDVGPDRLRWCRATNEHDPHWWPAAPVAKWCSGVDGRGLRRLVSLPEVPAADPEAPPVRAIACGPAGRPLTDHDRQVIERFAGFLSAEHAREQGATPPARQADEIRAAMAAALQDSIVQWWQTPPRLDFAADALMDRVVGPLIAERDETSGDLDRALYRRDEAWRELRKSNAERDEQRQRADAWLERAHSAYRYRYAWQSARRRAAVAARVAAERDAAIERADHAEREREEQRQRADQLDELLDIAHQTSNRSEAERARAVQRADVYEAQNSLLGMDLVDMKAERDRLREADARIRKLRARLANSDVDALRPVLTELDAALDRTDGETR